MNLAQAPQSEAMLGGQLALPVRLADETTFHNLAPRAALKPLLHALKLSEGLGEPLNFLHGPTEGGKSHLLQALCHEHQGAVYLPLGELADLPAADLLAGLEESPLVAIDDLHRVAGRPDWEEALFHLINRARQSDCPLWFAAQRPPSDLALRLADLQSRLAGGVTWALPRVSDEEKVELLVLRADRRGLSLPEAVAVYLCRHGSRSLGDLLACLDRLDEVSLQRQRPITVPLVREVMGW